MGRGVAARPRPAQGVPGGGRSGRPGRGLALAPALAPGEPGDRGGAAGGNRGRARTPRKRRRTGARPREPPTATHQQHTISTQETKVTKTYRDSRKQGTLYPLADFRWVRKGYKIAQRTVNQCSELRLRQLVRGKVTPVLLYGGQLFELPADGKLSGQNTVSLRASLGVFPSMGSVQRQEEKSRHEESKE